MYLLLSVGHMTVRFFNQRLKPFGRLLLPIQPHELRDRPPLQISHRKLPRELRALIIMQQQAAHHRPIRQLGQVVERHVLHLDAKVEEAEERADTSGSSGAIEAEAIQLHELVARSLGSKHWTTVRLVGILSRMDVM